MARGGHVAAPAEGRHMKKTTTAWTPACKARRRAAGPLAYADIAAALARTRNGTAMPGTVATRLSRAVTFVKRALDAMVALGFCRVANDARGHQHYTLIAEPPSDLALAPRPNMGRPKAGETSHSDIDEAENTSRAMELALAERLWRERMGTQRWRDDPRAVAERVPQTHLRPPF